jgi:intracellular multiplication protein IcmK
MIRSSLMAFLLFLVSSYSFAQDISPQTDSTQDQVAALLNEASSQDVTAASSAQPKAVQAKKIPQSASTAKDRSANQKSSIDVNSLSNQAFSRTITNMMPMSEAQIKALHYMLDNSQRAAAAYPAGAPPRPTSSSVVVNLSPGATPPVVRLRAGFVTAVNFLDSTGGSWPIAAYDLGDPGSFNIQWDHKGSTLLVQATAQYKSGNLAVMLKGMGTPVMITLIPGQGNVDYRVDLSVPGMGPNASAEFSGAPLAPGAQLVNFLDGVPPTSAQSLEVAGDGNQSQVWAYQGQLYLRTRARVLSPSWSASMKSADGTYVYQMQKAPVILVSEAGAMVQLLVKGL